MRKLTPLDINDPKWQDYQPRMGKLTLVVAADFLPALPTYMTFSHESAGQAEGFSPEEMEDANPFREVKIVKQQMMIPRVAIIQYENVEISTTLFAILEYLRLVGKVHFWYTDDGICADKEQLDEL